jgi:hypothetical protein
MAEITSLTTLAKANVVSTDYVLVANSSTKKAKKLQAQTLFPSLTTLGTSSEALFVNVTNSNQINLKGLKSADATKLTVTTASNNLVLTLVESGIDLNNCDNTTSGFLSSVDLDGTVSGTLTPLRGGTGIAGITKGSVLYGSNTNAIAEAALTTNGNILVGNSSNGYPSVGAITSTGGSITVNSSATPGNINLEIASTNNLTGHLDCNAYHINLDDAAGNSFLSGNGTAEGVHVDADGKVYIGDDTPTVFAGGAALNIITEGLANGIQFGNTSGTYGKGGGLKWMDRTSSGNGMDASLRGANGHTNGNGGDITLQAGAGVGSGDGGDITLTAGDADSGTPGKIILRTETAGGTATTAMSIDLYQNASFTAGVANPTGVMGSTLSSKSQIANGASTALVKNTHNLAPADGNNATLTLPTIANSAVGDTIIVEYQVGINNGQTHKYGTSTEMFMGGSACYRMDGSTGSAVGLIQTVDVADGTGDDFLNLIGLTNAGPGIGTYVIFTFNGSKWRAEARCTSSGTGVAANLSVFATS